MLWIEPLETWLAELGLYIYPKANYLVASIGEEISGLYYAKPIEEDGGVSEQYRVPLLYPENGEIKYYSPKGNRIHKDD